MQEYRKSGNKKYIRRKRIFGSLLVSIFVSACSHYYQGPSSDHFNGRKFFDPYVPMEKGFLDALKWRLSNKRVPWPQHISNLLLDKPPTRVEGHELRVSVVGHATFLIQTQGLNILTDPVWSERASPVSFAGPKRVIDPGIPFDALPPIDIVLISHNHYDHLDLGTLDRLWKKHKPRIITPLGNDAIIQSHNPTIAVDVGDWYEAIQVNHSIMVHIVPAQHWSARSVWDRNKALWGSFVITTPGGNIYFGGDSGYGEGRYFKKAKEKFGHFRLALLPMGAYIPRWFMEYAHMGPEEMVRAHIDLGLPITIPGHYDVFPLADEAYGQARKDLLTAQERYKIANTIYPLAVGAHMYVPRIGT
jgi:L-ascorbate metabolism protein UlaG (beta-lactamase superfamily)